MSGTIDTEIDGPLGWITINRPERRNALNAAMWDALPEAVQGLDANDEVRVILLRGAGEEAFAAGADIAEFAAMESDTAAMEAFEARFEAAQAGFENTGKPVIAAIKGFCMGGGLALALACDLRLASTDARFAIPAAKLGLGYAPKAIARLVRAVGAAKATGVLATARTYDAEEALAMGLATDLAEGDVFAAARNLAETVAANAPLTICAAKASVLALAANADTANAEALTARCMTSDDYAEGRKAFLEKRKPVFRGK